jgi:hypothetical protein
MAHKGSSPSKANYAAAASAASAPTAPTAPSSLSALASQHKAKANAEVTTSSGSGTADIASKVDSLTATVGQLADMMKLVMAKQAIAELPAPGHAKTAAGGGSDGGGMIAKLAAAIGEGGRAAVSAPPKVESKRPIITEVELDDVHHDGSLNEPSAIELADAEDMSYITIQYDTVCRSYFGKFAVWCRSVEWKDGRARREANTICRALDAFIDEGLKPGTSVGMEILSRRLAAMVTINEGKVKNPNSVADQLEYQEIDVMIPHKAFLAAVKKSSMYERVGGAPSGPAPFTTKKNNNYNKNKNNQTHAKKSAGGATTGSAK